MYTFNKAKITSFKPNNGTTRLESIVRWATNKLA